MMTRNFYIKFSFFIFIFVSLFAFSYVAACTSGESCTTEGETCTETQSCGSRTEYSCVTETDCAVEILQRSTSQSQDRTCTCGGCGAGGCTYSCSGWGSCYDSGAPGAASHHSNCSIDKVCQTGGSAWSSSVPNCEFLSDPSGGQTENGWGPVSPNNIYLPVKLSWDDVRGAKSYIFRAWEATTTLRTWEQANSLYLATTTGSTLIAEAIPTPCTLTSSTTFSWKVTPCCKADTTVCKNWNDVSSFWRFNTNLSPELISPFDPDWNKTDEKALNISAPVTLDWCDVKIKNIKSFWLRFYTLNGGVETCHPWLLEEDGQCHPEKITRFSGGSLVSQFVDRINLPYFIKNSEYRWELATCILDQHGPESESCSNYGQKWGFTTADAPPPEFNLLSPPNDPLGNNPVRLPVALDWQDEPGFNSFIYQVNPGGITGVVSINSSIGFDYPQLSLVSFYRWKVKPCWDYEGNMCEDEWSDEWTFKTTGAKPTLINPINGVSEIVIPIKFDWNDVPGAGSYRIQVSADDGFGDIKVNQPVNSSDLSVDYPDLEMDTSYWWRVQTCAHTDGTACNNAAWSDVRSFRTFKLEIPDDPASRYPISGTVFDTPAPITFGCDPIEGAKSYQFIIYNPSGKILIDRTISSNSLSLNAFDFPDLGNYTWKIKACLTEASEGCSVGGEWSGIWSFDISFEAPPGEEGGLVPCGRPYNDINTPWNEMDKCQIHHVFLLFRNILDFLLWKVATILLILLSTLAGILFYVSMGDSGVVFKVRSFLRSAVIGYFIIFFAWLIINLFLSLIGFEFQFFGHWWEIKF